MIRMVGLVLVLVSVLSGCAGAVQSGAADPGGGVSGPRPVPAAQNALPPGGCAERIGDPTAAQYALDAAQPGDQVCLSGPELSSAALKVTRGGTPGAPLRVLSDGASVLGIDVRADHVVVAGFTIRDGEGLTLNGAALNAHHNNVLNARMNGISCMCSDTVIDSNVVDGTDGTGIRVEGDRITVAHNQVSGSVRRAASDADGMRFFGTGIRISDHTVRDISAKGYPADGAPHTDCFQTYDSDAPPTYRVVISGNRCQQVDEQCLIATGERGNPGVPDGMRAIVFENNVCDVGGSQAIDVEDYPHVEIRGNTISGPNLYRGIHLYSGSVDSAVLDNVLVGDKAVFEADQVSQPVTASGNRNQ